MTENNFVEVTLKADECRPVRMNRASMVMIFEDKQFFITRRMYNILLDQGALSGMWIEKPIPDHYVDEKLTWFARPSIFA